MEDQRLIQQYLLGLADDDEVRELERLLKSSEVAQREFVRAAQLDVIGRDIAIEQSVGDGARPVAISNGLTGHASRRPWLRRSGSLGWFVAIAATTLLVIGLWPQSGRGIATIVSSENAAWESSLPTLPGDQLHSGTLNLKAGVATIRFGHGAELLLEAPAKLELISEMRCRLESGAAVVDVPESSIGFIVEAPSGYAEDFGTRFAVQVDETRRTSDFQLIKGEIEVHHESSGQSLRLGSEGSAVMVTEGQISRVVEPSEGTLDSTTGDRVIVLGTNGRCGTAMPQFQKRKKFIDPSVLSVKRSGSGHWDYRSFFSFSLAGLELRRLKEADLRLNLVPSERGLVSRLPKVNRFAVYGLTNEKKSNWEVESRWEDSPGPEDGVLLGKFEIERSQTRGVFGIRSQELLQFLIDHPDRPVTFTVVRETTQIEGIGPSLMHMFASDSHPESVGPQLELVLNDD